MNKLNTRELSEVCKKENQNKNKHTNIEEKIEDTRDFSRGSKLLLLSSSLPSLLVRQVFLASL